jgi:excisionase family DNA binding protein
MEGPIMTTTPIEYTPRDLLPPEEAAGILGISQSTLRRWARSGEVKSYKLHGIRAYRYSRADLEAVRARKTAPPPSAAPESPSPVCELVPLTVGPLSLQGLRLQAPESGPVELISTGLVEEALSYAPGSIGRMIRPGGAWADDFEEGRHYTVISGDVLRAVCAVSDAVSERAPSLHTLTEEGVSLVLLRTDRRIGVLLRRALAASGFMRAAARAFLSSGPEESSPAPTLPALPGGPPEWLPALLGPLQAQTEALIGLLQRQEDRIDRLERSYLAASEAASDRPPHWHRADLTADEVADHLSCSFPVFRNNPRLVHSLTGRSGLRGPSGSEGLPGFSEQRRDRTGYRRWYYSPACIRTLHDTARDLGYYVSEPGPGGVR